MSAHHRSASYVAASRIMRPRIQTEIDAGGSPCVQRPCRMGGYVTPGQPWDLGHIVGVLEGRAQGWTEGQINAHSNLGAAHRHENRSDGGRQGAAQQSSQRQKAQRFPQW
jgi:hypothetical protein